MRKRKYRKALRVDWKQTEMGKHTFEMSMKVNDARPPRAHIAALCITASAFRVVIYGAPCGKS
ncbi:hypothetical protein LOAG_14955 [Loa loa]|uniref:Uncharacterized protein n=1 Tax=Loa loa TaxID=7209 RepID=A0A1S0TI18_LOALO|nr:hypothetical protein LOAG_14955 [Loa loa]EFO13573.2 hypothetical protein LOAG_14955 [Loa loa]